MADIIIFIGYITFNLIAILLTFALIDPRIGGPKLLSIGILSAISDYVIKEILVPKFNLPDGFHLIIGVILITVLCYSFFKLKVGISFGAGILFYLLSTISEVAILLILILIFGKETLVDWSMHKTTIIYVGFITMIPMLLALIYIKMKNLNLLDKQISNTFYRM